MGEQIVSCVMYAIAVAILVLIGLVAFTKTGSWSLLVEGSMPGSLCIGTGGHLMGPSKRETVNPAERPS